MKKIPKRKIIGAVFAILVIPVLVLAYQYEGGRLQFGANGYVNKLRVGTGSTPGITLGDDDVFIEGTLEVDGAAQFDGAVTFAAAVVQAGGVQLNDNDVLDIGTGDDLSFVGTGTNVFTGTDTSNTIWHIGLDGTNYNTMLDLQIHGSTVANVATLDASADELSLTGIAFRTNGTVQFEGSTADDYETIITATDPTVDRTVTFPDASGSVVLTGNITVSDGADTACNTTCGSATCIIGMNAGGNFIACDGATADTCLCLTTE